MGLEIIGCQKHPSYKGIRKPRVRCFSCMAVWANKHPGTKEARYFWQSNAPSWWGLGRLDAEASQDFDK